MKKFILFISNLLLAVVLYGQVIHVPADYPTIQQGIDAANPGDTVLVAEGTYYENIDFLGKKPLLLSSEFILDGDTSHINNTIIDGSQATDLDHASVVTFATGEDTTSVICGFTLQGGKGTWDMNPDERCGGGIFIGNAGAKIIHNKITGNVLDDTQPVNGQGVHGAGIGTRPYDSQRWLVIEDNRITGNSATTQYDYANGGGIYVTYNARISGNFIADNSCSSTSGEACCAAIYHFATGTTNSIIINDNIMRNNDVETGTGAATTAGVSIEGAELLFSGNELTDNDCFTMSYGGTGAFSILNPATSTKVIGNVFKNNTSNYIGGAIFLYNQQGSTDPGEVLISGNYFLDNKSLNGGAIGSWAIPFVLENNVFSGNYAEARGGAVFIEKIGTYSFTHCATMINNSFSGNSSALKGGAIYSNKGMPLMFNTVLYGDEAPEGAEIYLNHYLDTLDMAYCDVDMALIYGNLYDGGGNFGDDPKFDDPELLTLQNASPCIDQGTTFYVCHCGAPHMGPSTDILGVGRPQSGEYEIGAYEATFVSVPEAVDHSPLAVSIYPNPTTGKFQITMDKSQTNSKLQITNGTIEVVDYLGNVISKWKMEHGTWNTEHDISSLPSGVYFVRICLDNEWVVKKIIKID